MPDPRWLPAHCWRARVRVRLPLISSSVAFARRFAFRSRADLEQSVALRHAVLRRPQIGAHTQAPVSSLIYIGIVAQL